MIVAGLIIVGFLGIFTAVLCSSTPVSPEAVHKAEERRLWRAYLATNEAAKYLGELLGARPCFMSFEEYKDMCKFEESRKKATNYIKL